MVDERNDLAGRAARDLKQLRQEPFGTTSNVLGEACFLLIEDYQRRRMRTLLDRLRVTIVEIPSTSWDSIFDWLERYEEHEPDLADAQLAVLCSREPWRLWTYDREFRTIWRRSNGSRIPLVGLAAAAK